MRYLFITGQAGCLLALLLLFNSFFGLFLFRPRTWLLIEAALVLFFYLNAALIKRKIVSFGRDKKDDGVIDVEGKVIEGEEDNKRRRRIS